MTTDLNVPVALIVFNRPSQTETVFKTIVSVRPKRLFIVADGPRPGHPADATRCAQVRAIVQNVTWPCDVRTDFADHNMGPDRRTISGTNWVFSQVDEAIFLEDDTVPDPSFFRFCEEMLIRYRDDRRVMSVCGFNLFPGQATRASYFFSILANPWGRAIWRRSWECLDENMRAWPVVRNQHLLSNTFSHRPHRRYWEAVLEHTYRAGSYYAWDYRFMLSCWLQNGLNVVPANNLVRNVGFGPDATHTKVDSGGAGKLRSQSLEFPLRHPTTVMRDRSFDDHVCDDLLRNSSILRRCKRKADHISAKLIQFTLVHLGALPKRAT